MRVSLKTLFLPVIAAFLLLAGPQPASALTIGDLALTNGTGVPATCETNNDPISCGQLGDELILKAWFSFNVAGSIFPGLTLAGNQVVFTFENFESGINAGAVITAIYLQDASGLFEAATQMVDADENGGQAGVDFSPPATPGDPPGIGSFTTAASTDSDPDPISNGVASGEAVGWIFTFAAGKDLDDLLNAWAAQDLQAAGHVQNLPNCISINLGAQSIISCDGTNNSEAVRWSGSAPPVPEPGTLGLLGAGLFALGAMARRRLKA